MSPAVRNIRSIGENKPIPIYVWVPPKFTAITKVEVINGTTSVATDITDIILEGEYIDGITQTIGSFSFTIDNSTQRYNNYWNEYDQIKIYMDYGASATTLKFVGLLERISKSNSKIILSGRGSAIRTIGKKVTYSATNVARSVILKAIIDKYFSGVITTTNLEEDLTTATVNYYEIPFWDVVQDLCEAGGRDAYIDATFDFHYFESGTVENPTECVVHESNLIETGDFSPDLTTIANRVRVYGKQENGVPRIATANSVTSQTNLGGDIKELIINDSSIISQEQAQARADFELARNETPPIIGEVISLGLPTISPGERIRISDPLNSIEPAYYTIQAFTHKFSNDEPLKTVLTVQKQRTDIPSILKKRIIFESKIRDVPNPNEMDYSFINTFYVDNGTHSGTEVDTEAGILKLADGESSGTWVSDTLSTDEIVTSIEARLTGNAISGAVAYISMDGGNSYTPTNFSGTRDGVNGKDIKIKIDINSTSTEIKTAAALYKF